MLYSYCRQMSHVKKWIFSFFTNTVVMKPNVTYPTCNSLFTPSVHGNKFLRYSGVFWIVIINRFGIWCITTVVIFFIVAAWYVKFCKFSSKMVAYLSLLKLLSRLSNSKCIARGFTELIRSSKQFMFFMFCNALCLT